MKSSIYTLTGDKGTTSLVGGQRVDKDNVRVEAYGTVDELNAWLGMLAAESLMETAGVKQLIFKIQNKLFNTGAYLATDCDTNNPAPAYGLVDADVNAIENAIDEMDAKLPKMQAFILPGGCHASSLCDICRTVARRAERRTITLARTHHVDPVVLCFLNRLSDFFFVLGRYCNFLSNNDEIFWDKNA